MRGGERLPWATADGRDNFDPLAVPEWQVHVYGVAGPDVIGWCEQRQVPLHVFAWRPVHEEARLQRDALYLMRPDSYVAMAAPHGSAEMLARYVRDRGLRIGRASFG